MNQDASTTITPIYQSLSSTSAKTKTNTSTSSSPEIRLLSVSPAVSSTDDSLISCTLTTHALDPSTSPAFVVLSYRWGVSSTTHQILLNGQPFHVRPNLWAFLRVIRQQPGMKLWIDALCINQQDVEERSCQVRIMGRIFRQASMVISWLGEGDGRIELAFEVMARVWANSSSHVDARNTPDSVSMDHDSERLPLARDGVVSEDQVWQAVVELCALPYWGRVWVVQEILLSSNNYLLCGNMPLPWQMFANFISLVDVRFPCPPQYGRLIHASTAKSYAASKPYTMVPQELEWRIGSALRHDYGKAWDTEEHNLFRILTMFGDRDCTDPLDHAYALLSLTEEGAEFPIRYGIDQFELYTTAIHFCGEFSQGDEARKHAQKVSVYRPVSQRSFMRNAKYLAEIMEIMPVYQKSSPYFHGATTTSARGPSPRPDPCFPCKWQSVVLRCTTIDPGNEPPVLRSNTLRRNMSSIPFDVLLHIDESASWLICQSNVDKSSFAIVGLVTIKDGPQGRGFRILDAGKLASLSFSRVAEESMEGKWDLTVPSDAHIDLLKAVILGVQPS